MLLGGAVVLLMWDGIGLIDSILASQHHPQWVTRADPTDNDFVRARAIVETAKAEVRALPQTEQRDIDREDATFTLAVAEGLSGAYEVARRNWTISPDALDRAEDIDYLSWQYARHRRCDADGCDEDFSQADYDDALISYTARGLAASRNELKPSPPKGFFERVWDWL